MPNEATRKRSPMWYELPILFSILGGIIAYFAIRNDDPVKAKRCIIIGLAFLIPIIMAFGIMIIGMTGTFVSQNPFYVVSSSSMEPALEVYDIVIADKSFPFENLQVGDIIVFDRPSGTDRVILHRIVEVQNEDPLTFKTKGDANRVSITGTDFPITKSEYIGKIDSVIPDVGGITQILRPPNNLILYLIQFIVFLIPIVLHVKFSRENRVSN